MLCKYAFSWVHTRTFLLFQRLHRIFPFTDVITASSRGLCLTISINMGHNKLLFLLSPTISQLTRLSNGRPEFESHQWMFLGTTGDIYSHFYGIISWCFLVEVGSSPSMSVATRTGILTLTRKFQHKEMFSFNLSWDLQNRSQLAFTLSIVLSHGECFRV